MFKRLCLLIACFAIAAAHTDQLQMLQDPTRPAAGWLNNAGDGSRPTDTAMADMKLTAVFFQDDKGYAILNGQTLTEGQAVDGFRLVKINHNSVIVAGPERQT